MKPFRGVLGQAKNPTTAIYYHLLVNTTTSIREKLFKAFNMEVIYSAKVKALVTIHYTMLILNTCMQLLDLLGPLLHLPLHIKALALKLH